VTLSGADNREPVLRVNSALLSRFAGVDLNALAPEDLAIVVHAARVAGAAVSDGSRRS